VADDDRVDTRRVTAVRRRPARALYDHLSLVYGVLAEPWERRPRRRALELLSLRPGECVLEVGIGSGADLRTLGRAGCHAWGLDLSMGMLRRAGRLHGARVVCGDALALPVSGDAFDVVYASFTLELFATSEIPIVLSEALRILRPGGRLGIVSLTKDDSGRIVRVYEWAHRQFPALVDCRPIDARAALESAGFRISHAARDQVSGLPVEILVGRKPG